MSQGGAEWRGGLERWLNGVWYKGRSGAGWLWPLSALFGTVVALRSWGYRHGLYRVRRVGVPVVVIGNLTVGGTGKTPLTLWLATELARRGVGVGIVTRGYGGRLSIPTHVRADSSPAEVGDEAVLLAAGTSAPVVASPDRVAGAALLESLGVELILSDDGLQHYALGRELEVAVIDGDRGLGNGRLLPAGPLRESVERLSRTDFVVVNAASGTLPAALPWRGRRGTFCMRLEVADAIRLGGLEGARPLGGFVDDPVHGVAAIGHPERFFRMLREAGLRVIEHPFPDHHAFVAADLEFADSNAILMTSKDAVKCRQFANSRMWEVPVHASLAPEGGVLLVERVAALARKTTPTE